MKLTAKQEAFCLSYIETGNASESYRLNYSTKNMKPASVNRLAKALMDNIKIASRLEELRAPVRERALLSLESHLERLDHLSREAELAGQFAPAITAETNRGRAAGLYVEKLEHTGPDGGPIAITPTIIELVTPNVESED